MYQNTIAVPHSIIQFATDRDVVNTLAIWLKLKGLYKNTVIYKFNYTKLSERIGRSHGSLRKHIKLMMEYGWVKITKEGHLHLTGINKLKKYEKEKCVLVKILDCVKEQRILLRYIIIHKNIKRQERILKRKSEIFKKATIEHSKLSKKDLKWVMKNGGLIEFEKTFQDYTTLSNNKIGKLFKKSKWTGHRIQKLLNKSNLIKSKIRLRFVKICTLLEYNYLYRGTKFIFNRTNGFLYERLSNSISIPTKPVNATVYSQKM